MRKEGFVARKGFGGGNLKEINNLDHLGVSEKTKPEWILKLQHVRAFNV